VVFPPVFCDDPQWYSVLAPLSVVVRGIDIINSELRKNAFYLLYCSYSKNIVTV
jgi:hypothetical protein